MQQLSRAPPLLAFSPTSVYDLARNVLAVKQCCLFNQSLASDDAEKRGWWFVMLQTTGQNLLFIYIGEYGVQGFFGDNKLRLGLVLEPRCLSLGILPGVGFDLFHGIG
jgi:hypothetical protein